MNIFPFNFLFLNSRPPVSPPPPKGRIRLAFDAITGVVKAINSAGQEVPFSGSSGPIEGVTDGSDAADGIVGQYLRGYESGPVEGSSETNFVTLELPAGDWDVVGSVQYVGNSISNDGSAYVEVSMTSIGPFQPGEAGYLKMLPGSGGNRVVPLITEPVRFSLTETTNVYLRVHQDITASSQGFLSGSLRARRVR